MNVGNEAVKDTEEKAPLGINVFQLSTLTNHF